jgi:hypothetical protein
MNVDVPSGLTPFRTWAGGHMWRASPHGVEVAAVLADPGFPLCPGCGDSASLVWLAEEITEDSKSRA